jgi:hypothetical protein
MTFNLVSVLPQLLPSAIAWAEEQSERTQQTGQPLDTSRDWLWPHARCSWAQKARKAPFIPEAKA